MALYIGEQLKSSEKDESDDPIVAFEKVLGTRNTLTKELKKYVKKPKSKAEQ